MMDRDTLKERPTDDSESTSPRNSTSMKKKKKLKQRSGNKRFAGQSSGDSSSGSEDVVIRPLRSARRLNRSIVSSESEDDTGSMVRSHNPANRLVLSTSSDSNIVFPSTSRCVQDTPSSSSSNSPIMIPHKNRNTIIGSDTSTSTSSDVIVNSRRGVVRQVISDSPSTSSDMQASRNGQPMSTDDDEGPQDFLRTNRLNKLSSTESSEDEDCPSCAICLSSLANRIAAQISGCSHEFHNTCILKWSERTNTCPIDRSKFNKITVKNKEGKIVKVTEIDDKNAATADDDEQPFPDEVINCVICGSADNEDVLLLCDGCNRGFHIFCLNPPLDRVPEGNWICEHCSPVITLTDSIYFNDELDISIEDYSNQSDMSASSNEMSEDPDQPSTSTRPSRRGRYRSASTVTVSVSSRNQNLLRNTRVRHTTITIKQTRRRKKKRRGTRRSRRNVGPSTVSSRSRIMAAAIAKRNSAACHDRGNAETRCREKTIRSEPGRPRLSLFRSDNFEDYYNPESDGEDGGVGGSGDVGVAARSRFPTPRLMDRKAAVARLINTNRRPRVAPRVTIPSATSSASSVNVLDDIMGMMEVENKKGTGSIPMKKDGTFSIPEKVDINSDKNKEKVTETPGYPGAGIPNRGRGYYNSPGGGGGYQGQNQGARHNAGVFSSRGASPQFPPRFSPFPTGRSDGFQSFRTPQPRFRSNAPRRFPNRRSLPASLLMESEADQEEQPDEDVDIYGDIDSNPLVNLSAVGTLEPPPQPPAALFDLGPPPEPPAALLNIGSPEEGPSDEEKGLIIDDNEYDPADPCDSPETIENPPSISSDSSSDGLGAIPIPEAEPSVHSCAPRPANTQQSDSEEDCPNTSLYSSTSLAFARNQAKNNGDSERENDQESPVKPSPTKESNSIGAKSGPIRFSIGSKHVLSEPPRKIDLFSDDDDNESNSNDEESKEENVANEIEEQINSKKDEEVVTGVVGYASDEDEEKIETPEENVSQDSEIEAKDDDKLSNENDVEDGENLSNIKEDEDKDSENEGEELSEEIPLETEETSEPVEASSQSPKDNSDEMSPRKSHAQAVKSLEEEIFGSEKGEENEVDKDEVSTQGEEILDLNTENLQGVTDATVHEGSIQDTEEKEEDEEHDGDEDARAKSESYNALDGLDVDPVSDSEYGSLSDNAEVDEAGKIDKKKKKKRKNTDREEGEIVEPKKKDRKKDKDENNENGLGEKKTKKKKEKDFELSPLQEKTFNNNKDNQDQEPGESVSWKKLSKNTKDRNYRDKDDIKGRKKKEGRKELERYNVRKIVGEKAFIRKDEFGRDISVSRSKSPSFGRSPRRRSRSRKRSLSRDRSKSPGRKNKKRRSRSKSLDRFRKRSLSRSPVRPRKRSRSPSLPKGKDRKIQKRGRSRSRSRRRSRTPKKLRSRSRSKPKKRSRSRDKGKGKLKKDKGGDNLKVKDIKKRKKRPRSRSWSKTRKRSRSPRGKSPFDFSSTSISRSPSPAAPATFRKSRSWSRDKNLTVIVPNPTNKKKDKKKTKENKRRKHKDDHSPTLSKEVFTSGDNILVSVNFAHAEKNVPEATAKVDKVKPTTKRSKKDIQAMKAAKVKEIAAKAKPVAIIDLDVSPFRERTPSPKEVIVLCDSDSDIDAASAKANEMKAISSGPKTPPEPHIKFSINSKNQTISTISNPLMDIDDKQGPNTPPDPPSPGPTSPYDPFDPTKSRSPSPALQSAPNDSIELKTPNDNLDKNQLDLLKPAATPSKDSTQSPSKVISVTVLDDNSGSNQMSLSKQDDKLVTSSMSSTLQSSLPIYTPAMSNSNGRNNINGAEAMEDILNIDSDGVYSPGSSLGDDLFDPPKKSPPPSSVNKKFDSLFVAKNSTSAKSIPYEPKHTKPLLPVSGTPKKGSAPKYTPTKTKSSKPTISKLDEDQLKILDEVPSSAVEMQVKYKYLKKLNRQERVVEEVKHVLKPHYNKKHVTKEQYKDILRKSVPKICHNKSGEINPSKIHSLIEAYVKKYRIMNKKRTGGNVGNSVATNNNNTNNIHNNINSNNVGAKKKTMWN